MQLSVAVQGLLMAVPSLTAEHGLSSSGSWALEHRLSSYGAWACFSEARGTLLDEGLNQCLLHWQVDSLSLSHQGSLLNVEF